ncbi:MAG: efflux RND transporter periplasmic adaptor subunit [Cytophagales bacterium]
MNQSIINISKSTVYVLLLMFFIACQNQAKENTTTEDPHHEEGLIHLSKKQFDALGLRVDKMVKRNLNAFVETNGQLTLPPQSEASVSAVIGANISQIKVIEGDRIKKGQVLAYISHPDLFKLQSDFIKKTSELDYLELEYQRQENLYNEKINSGREFQKVKSDYLSLKAEIKSLEYTLKLLNANPEQIKNGKIYEELAIRSPISGYIRSVNVRGGKYVQAQENLFEIVNNDHIHAHFLVYEMDIQKVKVGQKVKFKVASLENKEYEAVIFSVGKVFESDPKAVEIHAEIENEEGLLISGMYCRGRIITGEQIKNALPVDAIVMDGDKKYVFTAGIHGLEWEFAPMEVITGLESEDWVEVKLLEDIKPETKFAQNQAYYLLSEWKKDEAGHGHSH